MEDEILFSMTGIEKSFGPVHVLKRLNLKYARVRFTHLWARTARESLL